MSADPTLTLGPLDLPALHRFASALLQRITPPAVFGLTGTLGAGKTTLVQAIASAAGMDPADVTSPTFTLVQTYRSDFLIHHLDAYRIVDEDEFLELGIDELLEDEPAWTLIEWADRVAGCLPRDVIWIEIRCRADSEDRDLTLRCPQARWQALRELADEWA